jgi:hypothetical protein
MMFGGVPISVTMPPRIEPKDRGMSRTAAARFALAAVAIATGMNRARAPTLFMNPLKMAAAPESTAIWPTVDPVAGRTSRAK